MCSNCSSVQTNAIDRRKFIKISAAGIAGAALLGATGSGAVFAQPRPPSLMAEFEAAAEEFDVPMELLLAMGWVNTRWEMPPPDANVYEEGNLHGIGLYGIMALVKNPSSDTLGEASALTGIPEDELKADRAANIRGGAALLAESRRAVRVPASADGLDRALAAVEGTPADDVVAGVGGGELYQEQVLEALNAGASGTVGGGERITLGPQDAFVPREEAN